MHKLGLTGAATTLMLFVPLQAGCGSASPTAVNSVVNVSIKGSPPTNFKVPGVISFTPKTAKRGTVTFRITNTDTQDHYFSINNALSADIPAHAMRIFKVTFTRPGVYTGSCPDADISGIGGLLKIT